MHILLAISLVVAVTAPEQAPTSAFRVVVIEGEDAVNIIQQRTAVAPVVQVLDRNNQPVAGAVVTFAVRIGGATFNGASTISVTTNAVGQAAATGLAPSGSGILQIGATATFQGQTAAAVTITQTNVLTAAQAAAAGAGGASGSSGGAAAGGGAGSGGGGISGTALGIAGGAAAAGAVVVATKSGSEEEAAVATAPALPPIFSADTSATMEVRFVSATFGGAGCADIDQNQFGLTLRLDSADGPPSGTFDVAVVQTRTPGTCASTVDNNFRYSFQVKGRVSGSRDNLVATATLINTYSASTSTGEQTQEWILNGRIVDNQLSGVLTYTHTYRYHNFVFNDNGTGAGQARMDVVFNKTR